MQMPFEFGGMLTDFLASVTFEGTWKARREAATISEVGVLVH